jgi:hypothetical protein
MFAICYVLPIFVLLSGMVVLPLSAGLGRSPRLFAAIQVCFSVAVVVGLIPALVIYDMSFSHGLTSGPVWVATYLIVVLTVLFFSRWIRRRVTSKDRK